MVREKGHQEWLQELSIEADIPIVNIGLSNNQLEFDESIQGIDSAEPLHRLIRDNELRPTWQIQLNSFKKNHKLTLRPLDINGVNFSIKLPTANSRLEEQEVTFD